MYLPVVIILFSPCLTMLFEFENSHMFLSCVLAFLTKVSLDLQVHKKYNVQQAESHLSQPVFRNTVNNMMKSSCRVIKR